MKKKLGILVLFCLFVGSGVNAGDGDYLWEISPEKDGGSGGRGGATYTCSSGGRGSISCSASFSGGGGSVNGCTSCSVSCAGNYYACCNAYHNKCQCRKS